MEKAAGIELESVWEKMTPRDKFAVAKQLASITASLSRARFSHLGSLYYRRDIDPAEGVPVDKTFAIGPTTARCQVMV